MENITQIWTQSRPFFPKSGRFFQFSKKVWEASPLPPSGAPVSVAIYTSISLNMSKYPWKCLNKLFWLCYGSRYVWSSYMFENSWMSLNMPKNAWKNCSNYARVLNMPWCRYNSIIIIVTGIILEFLSARFVHLGALLPFYLFLTRVRTKE